MVSKSWGRVINMSSRAHLGNKGQTNYSASKAGVIGLTRSLSLELGKFGVTANCIAPGIIATPGVTSLPHYRSAGRARRADAADPPPRQAGGRRRRRGVPRQRRRGVHHRRDDPRLGRPVRVRAEITGLERTQRRRVRRGNAEEAWSWPCQADRQFSIRKRRRAGPAPRLRPAQPLRPLRPLRTF